MAVLHNLDHSGIPEKSKIDGAMFGAGAENAARSIHVCVARLTYKNPWNAFMACNQSMSTNYIELQCRLEWSLSLKTPKAPLLAPGVHEYNYHSLPSSFITIITFSVFTTKTPLFRILCPGFLQNFLTIEPCVERVDGAKNSNKCPDDIRDAFFRAHLRNTISKTTCLRRETVGGLGRDY